MLNKEIIEKSNLNKVFLSDEIWVLLGGMRIPRLVWLSLFVIDWVALLGPLQKIFIFYRDEEFAQQLVLLAGVVFAHDHLRQRCEAKEVDIHNALLLDLRYEICVELSNLRVRSLGPIDQEVQIIRLNRLLVLVQTSQEGIQSLLILVALS